MRSFFYGYFFSGMLPLLVPFIVHAAPWDYSQRLSRMTTVYDVTQVETAIGTVEKIYEKTPSSSSNPNSLGYHMVINTEKESLDIHLGPTWYLKGLERIIAKGDSVIVDGSKVEGHTEENGKKKLREIRASEVRMGKEIVLKLRDSNGKPYWSNY